MFPNTFSPYWWMPQMAFPFGAGFGFGQARQPYQRIDLEGIPVLSTNAVQLTEATVDYGINPCQYNSLPCESIVLLRIHAAVPVGGEALPVTLVVPSRGRSTLDASTSVAGAGTATGTTKLPILDSQNTQIVGSDVEATTERFAYINKCTGVIRFLEFTSGAAAAAATVASLNE